MQLVYFSLSWNHIVFVLLWGERTFFLASSSFCTYELKPAICICTNTRAHSHKHSIDFYRLFLAEYCKKIANHWIFTHLISIQNLCLVKIKWFFLVYLRLNSVRREFLRIPLLLEFSYDWNEIELKIFRFCLFNRVACVAKNDFFCCSFVCRVWDL